MTLLSLLAETGFEPSLTDYRTYIFLGTLGAGFTAAVKWMDARTTRQVDDATRLQASRIQQLEAENASLRSDFGQLRKELDELKDGHAEARKIGLAIMRDTQEQETKDRAERILELIA